MMRLIAAAGFVFVLTASAYAMTPAPVTQADSSAITQVAFGCGPGRTLVAGVCVARTTRRHVRRGVRRCVRWGGGVCRGWRYY